MTCSAVSLFPDQTSTGRIRSPCVCVCVCSDVSFWDLPTPPQVHRSCCSDRSSVGSSQGGEEGEVLSSCPPAGGRLDPTPAQVEGIWTCSRLTSSVCSTDCQDEGGSIDMGGRGLPWVAAKKEVEGVTEDRGEGRRVEDGDVSVEEKICRREERKQDVRGKEEFICKLRKAGYNTKEY